MSKFYIVLSTLLLIVSVYLIVIDNYFASLILFSLGILNLIMACQKKTHDPKNAKIFFILGLFIMSVTFLGDSISGYINLETLDIYQSQE
jgi:4-hydroxybenzoate polyprenyltransferase